MANSIILRQSSRRSLKRKKILGGILAIEHSEMNGYVDAKFIIEPDSED